MTDIDALIKKLEKTELGYGELDKEIEVAVGRRKAVFTERDRADDYFKRIPEYTTSLDAALTLVPNGFSWRVSSHDGAEIWKPREETPWTDNGAATPALALCIAALRAIKAKETDSGIRD